MMRTVLVVLALVAVEGSGVLAQGPLKLNVDRAIEMALTTNKGLDIARRSIGVADAQIDQAYSSVYPKVDLNARYTRNIERPVFFLPDTSGNTRPISIGSANAIQGDLSVSQIIFNNAVFTGVGTAETYARISRQQLRVQANETAATVRRAFYAALLARDALSVHRALLANAEENYKTTQALYKGGLRSEFDAIRAEVQVANLKPVVVQGEDTYRNAVDNLRIAVGLVPGQEVELDGNLSEPRAANASPNVDEARRLIEQFNPGLAALRLTKDVERDLIEINRSDYLPTVAAFATYQYQAQSDDFSGLSFQPTAYVGLNLSINLFNGGSTAAQVQQARIKSQQSDMQLRQTVETLATQVEGILRSMNYARERIVASDRTISQAEKGYRIAIASYKAGTGTQLQINDADLALAQSRLNRLAAMYDYHVAEAQLDALIGNRVVMTDDGDDVRYVQP